MENESNQEPKPSGALPPPKKKKRKYVRKKKQKSYKRTPEQKERDKIKRRKTQGSASHVYVDKKKEKMVKCTPEVIKILSQCFLIGSDVVIATAMAGISKNNVLSLDESSATKRATS